MSAATWNLLADQGKTWRRRVRYGSSVAGVFTPFDNTGWSARMQLRRTIGSTTPALSISTATGEIVLTGADGGIEWEVDAVTAEDLSGKYYLDLELIEPAVPDPIVYGVFRGTVNFRPEVTR